MRTDNRTLLLFAAATLTASALAAAKPAVSSIIGMGVGANAGNAVTVRIDGKPTLVHLANVPAGDERAQAFLQCVVKDRVIRVEQPKRGADARLVLLDGTDVNTQVAEFLQSQTQADPCTLGKAVYTPKVIHANVNAAPAAPTQTAAAAPAATKANGDTNVNSNGDRPHAISRTHATVQPKDEQPTAASAVRKPKKP